MERPPLWKFRTYADAVSWSCTRSKINMISIKVWDLHSLRAVVGLGFAVRPILLVNARSA